MRATEELEGERGDGDVQEGDQLTLVALVLVVEEEVAEIDANQARRRGGRVGEERAASMIPSLPDRFLQRRGRGRGDGAFARLRSTRR